MVKKETPLIGGLSLRYDWDNLELMAETLNLESLTEFGQFFINSNIGLKHIKIMIWAGLQRPDVPFDIKNVGSVLDEYLDSHSLPELMELVLNAMGDAWGKQGEAKGEILKKPPKPLKNS
jgi:hypothetical protein